MTNGVTQITPTGYKPTVVGVIPNDWDVVRIKDIFRVTRGQVLSMTKLESGKIGKYRYPVYSSQTLNNGLAGYYTDYLFEDCITWTTDGAKAGDVKYRSGKFYCTNVCGVLENKNGYSNLCNASIFNSVSRKYVSYVGNPKLMNNVVADIQLAIPKTINEQEVISNVLNDLNLLIQSTEKLITKKQAIKQGAMQELLTGKRRLPGFSGEWIRSTIGSVLKVKHGKGQKEVVCDNGKYPILATGGEIGRTNEYLYNKPSVLIGRKGTIDTPQFMNTPFWTVDTLFYTQINEENDPKYIYYLFNTIDWYSYNEASGVPSLNAKTIENIEIVFPPTNNEQIAIASTLTDLDSEIEALNKVLEKYNEIKHGAMQVLLTGKIRLIKN